MTTYSTLSIPLSALALRALRPSPRGRHLPVRTIQAPIFSVHCATPTDSPLWTMRDVPVYVKHPRAAAAGREAYLSH